jgi:S-adenosylmethionine decarboxylase
LRTKAGWETGAPSRDGLGGLFVEHPATATLMAREQSPDIPPCNPDREGTHRSMPTFGFIAGLRGRAMTGHSLGQIGVSREAEACDARAPGAAQANRPAGDRSDHPVERDGLRYAGTHLIIDLWEGERFDDVAAIELALRRAVDAAGATLLHLHLHEFSAGGGVSAVAMLAESHISIHTWPERSYAAVDVFMCGSAAPDNVVPIFRQAFNARRVAILAHLRGLV